MSLCSIPRRVIIALAAALSDGATLQPLVFVSGDAQYWFLCHVLTADNMSGNSYRTYCAKCINDKWSLEEWGAVPITHASSHASSHAADGSDPIDPDDIGAVGKSQGTDNAGKVLAVGADGYVTLKDGGGGVFYAEVHTTTSAEIEAAYQAGMAVYAKYGDGIFPLSVRTGTAQHAFIGVTDGDDAEFQCCFCFMDAWTVQTYLAKPKNHASSHAVNGSDPISPGDIGAVAIEQGTGNAGQPLVVGSDGNVAPAKKVTSFIVREMETYVSVERTLADGTTERIVIYNNDQGEPSSMKINGGESISIRWISYEGGEV